MSTYIYWIYFEKVGIPLKIVAQHNKEFISILNEMIERNKEMPEWIQRTYK